MSSNPELRLLVFPLPLQYPLILGSLIPSLCLGQGFLFPFVYGISSTKQHSWYILSIQRNACMMNKWMNE